MFTEQNSALRSLLPAILAVVNVEYRNPKGR